MNKTVAQALGLIAALLVAGPSVVEAVDLKIAYVDFDRVLEAAPQIPAGRARMEEEFNPRNVAIERRRADLEGIEQRLFRDSAIMTSSQVQELELEARTLRREIQRSTADLMDEMNYRANEVRKEVEEEIGFLVQQFAQENGYDLILVTQVLYVSDEVDITDQILELLTDSASSGDQP